VLPGVESYDRTTINAWEDEEFLRAVKATGRKKLIMAALWTEACLAFPALDALKKGYEVDPVVDAVGGTPPEAHRAALERIVQAGAKPTGWVRRELAWSRKRGSNPRLPPWQEGALVEDVKGRLGIKQLRIVIERAQTSTSVLGAPFELVLVLLGAGASRRRTATYA
jgi:hypothetical protein